MSGILAEDFNGYVSFHARGNGHDLYSFGTPREFPVDIYSKQDGAELEYKRLDPSSVEKTLSDILLKKMAVEATLGNFEESKERFVTVSRQKDIIFSDYNSYVSSLKRGGVPNVDAYLKELAKENGSIKEEFDRFSEAPIANQLNASFEDLISLRSKLENKVESLDKRFDPVLPDSKASGLDTMVFKSHDEMHRNLLSERIKEAISLIFDAFEDGILSSRVENGEFIYTSTSAEVLAALVNTIFLPRYQEGAKIVATEGGSSEFRNSNNFELRESNDDRWQAPMDQKDLSTNINIAVFGPRGSGKTTFLNTANHFASTLDKGVAKAIDEAHGMGYPGLPLSAWANRGFNHSWTHSYYGNDEFTVGSLRAQLPALASDSLEFVRLCKDPTCSSVNVHEHKYLRPNPVQKGSTEANGEVLDSINTVKVGMIPQYHFKALDVRGFIPDDNIFSKKGSVNSNPLLRAMVQNKDFESLDGLVLVLNAQKILNDDHSSSYKRSTENQLLAINEIRTNSDTGNVRPLHVVFTHFLDLVKNGENIEKSSSDGESAYLAELRNQLHAHLRELMGTAKENINIYFIDQEYLWSDSKSLKNKNRFIHYKTAAHEVVRLFENVNKNAWEMGLDDFRQNFADALEEKRIMLKYSTGKLDSTISAYRKSERDQGDFSVDGNVINQKDKEYIKEKQAAALQIVQVGLDDQKNIQMQERGSAPIHYFLQEENPDRVWWNHHRGRERTAGRDKLVELVVDQIKDLTSKGGINGSDTGRDLFVVRSLGKLGKLKGQYCWHQPYKRYDITDCTLIHKVLEGLENNALVSDDLKLVRDNHKSPFEQAKGVASKYRDNQKWKTAESVDGGDLHMVAVFARSVDKKSKEAKIELVYIDIKKASALSGEVDISKWLF
ncbi:MAG: hypothetical protein AB8G05_13860 [Oligoflexales bacterium]